MDPPKVLDHLARMLAPGGHLIVIAPTLWLRAPLSVRIRKVFHFAAMAVCPGFLHLDYRRPQLDARGGDSDAVYWTNPYELWRMLGRSGLVLQESSWLRCRAIARKPPETAPANR